MAETPARPTPEPAAPECPTASERVTRRYEIEFRVESSMRSHGGQPFDFRLEDATVTLHLPGAEAQQEEFVAGVRLSETAVLLAEQGAHDALAKILDVAAFEMKLSATVVHPFRSQPEETGEVRHCVVYLVERRSRPLFLMPGNAREIQRLVDEGHSDVETALYWLRWSYAARRVPDGFLFTWMALEKLAGVEQIASRCRTCEEPVVCPTHGPHLYTGASRKSIKKLLDKHNVNIPDRLLKMRHPLVHGDLVYTFEKRLHMGQMLPDLRHAVEEELRERLGASTALNIPSEGRGPITSQTSVHCRYRTAYPADPFPPDVPTHGEIAEHQEAFRRGRAHPKIIDVLSYPPDR